MFKATVEIESLSPISFSRRYVLPEKDEKESDADYEKRTWRERLHYDTDGMVFIPPMAPKICIAEAAYFLGLKIPGKRGSTYTKHFQAGILVTETIPLGIHKDNVDGEWLFVPSNGKTGGSTRVDKCFPVIPRWAASIPFHILDGTITEKIFTKVWREAGNFIGMGRFRPKNNGYYGRFALKNLVWETL